MLGLEGQDQMIGRVLLGRYRIMAALAQGGMGVVYLARMEGSAGFLKPVVIKLILPGHTQDPDFVGMFEREAHILSLLRDSGIVNVLEFSRDGDAYVMVLEYVRGYHLGQWLAYLRAKKQQMPTTLAIQLVVDVLKSLHHAHTACHADGTPMCIVHRDISPSNILLDSSGRARLLDFGVARMTGEEVYRTQVKGFRGKLSYSAPELFSGGEATAQSDVYACAMVLHEILLGRNAFRGSSDQETLHNLLTKPVPPAAAVRDDVPESMDFLLRRALSKDPSERYPSAAALATALRAELFAPEHHIREELAHFVRHDVLEDLARGLGIESLVDRDRAWQRTCGEEGCESGEFAAPKVGRDGDRGHSDIQALDGLPESSPEGPQGASHRSEQSPVGPAPVGSQQLGAKQAAAGQVARRQGSLLRPREAGDSGAERGERGSSMSWPSGLVPQVSTGHGPPLSAPLTGPSPAFWVGLGVCVLALFSLLVGILAWLAGDRPSTMVRVVEFPDQVEAGVNSAALAASTSNAQPVGEPKRGPEGFKGPEGQKDQAALAVEPRKRSPGIAEARTLAATRRRASRRRNRPNASAVALTQALRKKQPQIQACFVEHAKTMPDTPRLELRFAIDEKGKLLSADLKPGKVGSTALGACILEVSRATKFPALGRPLEFRIPVTARRVR